MADSKIKSKCLHCALYTDSRYFCSHLSEEALAGLADKSRTISLKRGESLEGEALERWPIVAVDSGVMSMQHLLQDGRKTIAALFMRGDIIDLRNLANRNRGSLIALGKVNLCRLSPAVFEKATMDNPNAQKVIWENLRDQAFRAMDHSGDIAKKQAVEKLASFVFECRGRQEGDKKSDLVEIPVRRIDLAEYLGMQPETVSRCFKDLEKRGILEAPSLTSIRIIDVPTLRRIANGEKNAALRKNNHDRFKVLQFG